jgi:hypothetical protein
VSNSSLDELLEFPGEEPEPESPAAGRETAWFWLAKALVWAAVLALPIWVFCHFISFAVPYPLIAMVLFVGRLLRALLRWIDPHPLPATLVRPSNELVSEDQIEAPAQDGLVLATAKWDQRLSWLKVPGDKGHFARAIQPRLVEIVDERLRARHGVDRVADPAAARRLLGEQLWTFVTTPVPKNPSPRELAGLITQLENV